MVIETKLEKFFIELSYDGLLFSGWQKQINSKTIQKILEDAFFLILKKKVTLYGSGRTDAGVHALSQVAHLCLPCYIDLNRFQYQLNQVLPREISINKFIKVNESAHARFDALNRTYIYKIIQKKNPFLYKKAYYYNREVNFNLLNSCCKILIEKNNFKSFSKTKTCVNNYICRIVNAVWTNEIDHIRFTITANRFLRGMVRTIVGTMLLVNEHKITINEFENIINYQNRTLAGKSVAPYGLYLSNIEYPSTVYKN